MKDSLVIEDLQEGLPAARQASRTPGIKSPYLLSHGSDAPVLGLGTGGGGGGRHPHLAAFPAEALGAAVEAAQQILGRNSRRSPGASGFVAPGSVSSLTMSLCLGQ